MNIVHTEANCKNCFKCIRNCAVKAILFRGGQARIMGKQCVMCGKCLNICPQQANHVPSQLEAVRERLGRGERVLASIDPAYVAAFPGKTFAQFSSALKKLGFWRVEESAAGGSAATREYTRLLEAGEMKNIITTSCVALPMLIEKYFPGQVGDIAPVASPHVIHGRMAKAAYGEDTVVVHLTPCIAKLRLTQKGRSVDHVLLFNELLDWFDRAGIELDEEDPEAAATWAPEGRKLALPGGVLSNIPREVRRDYSAITVDGFTRCITVLESIETHKLEGFFFEMMLCDGGCVAGPATTRDTLPFVLGKSTIYQMAGERPQSPRPESETAEADLVKHYTYDPLVVQEVTPAEIREVFRKIGKDTPESILDCGTCGYNTCREKAIAVCQGRADLHMCLPYLRERAESMSSVILDNTPNATLVVGMDMQIQASNIAAQKIFGKTASEMIGTAMYDLVPIEQFAPGPEEVLRPDFSSVTYTDPEGDLILDVLMVATRDKKDYIVIARDITGEEKSRAEIVKISRETIETTQKVIDKQMRVAQEIASLLGETTGETKAAISKLQRSLMTEEERA